MHGGCLPDRLGEDGGQFLVAVVSEAGEQRAPEPAGVPGDAVRAAGGGAGQTGANVKAVQRMLGHASASMTLDVYAGPFGDDLDAVANRLDEAVAARDADHLRTGAAGGGVVDLGKRRSPGR
ncbi:hypothetical protein [Micromonospora sp. C28ISP2-4]|uniref:hypothetical protein n=1 Tax=Micromonospora sp. C28ISP2-4 TaxID=3059523 RepID=UPI002675F0AC|nr:hypothetical protein [Micromonospora sp. C28ISP2-4]MDO3683441.1 hypothetical protein [Micromonospora sp. C28ISP2-4]